MKRREFLKGLGVGATAVAVSVNLPSRSGLGAVEPANPYIEDDPSRWHTTMLNAVDDGLMDCAPGEYTQKLVKLMKQVMKRQEETIPATHDFKDLYMSKEAYEDIKNWGVDQIDENTRKETLGTSGPDCRMTSFPVEVTCDLGVASVVAYSFPVDGPFTEKITMVGNTKVWENSEEMVDNHARV